MSYSSVWYFNETVRNIPAGATAFGDRSQPWLFSIDAIWSRPEEDAANIAWVRRLWTTLRPRSNGRFYANFFTDHDREGQVIRDGVGAATHDRLVQVKRKYDPANFFRLNQNIVPG